MRAKPQVLGGIVGICIVLVAVVVIGQGAPKKASQDTLSDLAVSANRSMPRATPVSGLELTHASTLPGTLTYDYRFSAGATVNSASVTSAVVTLTTEICGQDVYQEQIFTRGLTLRMNVLNSDGSLLLSRDLKKAGCPSIP